MLYLLTSVACVISGQMYDINYILQCKVASPYESFTTVKVFSKLFQWLVQSHWYNERHFIWWPSRKAAQLLCIAAMNADLTTVLQTESTATRKKYEKMETTSSKDGCIWLFWVKTLRSSSDNARSKTLGMMRATSGNTSKMQCHRQWRKTSCLSSSPLANFNSSTSEVFPKLVLIPF